MSQVSWNSALGREDLGGGALAARGERRGRGGIRVASRAGQRGQAS